MTSIVVNELRGFRACQPPTLLVGEDSFVLRPRTRGEAGRLARKYANPVMRTAVEATSRDWRAGQAPAATAPD